MNARTKNESGADSRRYDRETWLIAALDTLAREGRSRLTLRHLAEQLGVTTGSFYWHFEDLDDFGQRLVAYWGERFTSDIRDRVLASSDDPSEQLLVLMRILIEEDITRYDVAVRAWAAHEPVIAEAVRKVDRARYAAVSELFGALGFDGPERDMRVRTFVVYQSMESAMELHQDKQARLAEVELRHAWFIRPGPRPGDS